MGFDVVSGPLFQTPEETVVLALDSGVDVVGASSLAAGHKTLIPELIGKLKEAGRGDIKVIAGGVIPPQDYQYLREAGVQGIYGPGSNVVECAADLLLMLGHTMPHLDDAASPTTPPLPPHRRGPTPNPLQHPHPFPPNGQTP